VVSERIVDCRSLAIPKSVSFAIPSGEQIEILRRSVRYLLAIGQVKAKAKQLNLTDEQRSQLREREATEQAAAESALLKLYVEVWLPRVEDGGLGIEKVAAGGRPLQTTLNEKKMAMIHERVMELLTDVQRRVHGTVTPSKIIELFRLVEFNPGNTWLFQGGSLQVWIATIPVALRTEFFISSNPENTSL